MELTYDRMSDLESLSRYMHEEAARFEKEWAEHKAKAKGTSHVEHIIHTQDAYGCFCSKTEAERFAKYLDVIIEGIRRDQEVSE